jgi:hypothetical protein
LKKKQQQQLKTITFMIMTIPTTIHMSICDDCDDDDYKDSIIIFKIELYYFFFSLILVI